MQRILVIRNDKIGDFMLAWPAFAMLKKSMPSAEITALVPAYTQELAELCPYIDNVLVDPGHLASRQDKRTLLKKMKVIGFDCAISFFSNMYNARLVLRTGIRYRLAPATKICQFLYNHRLKQKRSQSVKPEYVYNMDLIRAFLADFSTKPIESEAPYLHFSSRRRTAQREKLAVNHSLNPDLPWVFVHAGSGGSANNLSLAQYAQLIAGADQKCQPHEVVLTAGPNEVELATQLQTFLQQQNIHSVVYCENDGLKNFAQSIACAAVFIAGSTGPLHIAGALDVPTVGFFPAKRSATPLRWQPINSEGRHLAFSPPYSDDKKQAENMSHIEIQQILPEFQAFLSSFLCIELMGKTSETSNQRTQ